MKKFNVLVLMLAVSLGLSAQGIFTNTWWNPGEWPSADSPAEMSETPYESGKTVVAYKAGYDVVLEDLDEFGIADIWDKLGEEQFVNNLTNDAGGDAYDLEGSEPTFGASFKSFWDDDYLYIVLKYMDKNSVADADSRSFEIGFQLRDIDRYEAGFAAATTLGERNMQYCSYIELGGGKALFTADGVTETVRLIGQEGAWGSSLGAASTLLDYTWSVDQDGTIWAVLAMPFSDYLLYMVDEWGAYEQANYESLDPTTTTTISFEVKSNAAVGGEKMEYWWSSNQNNAYQSVYWNGYLEFDPMEFFGVNVAEVNSNEKLAYIYDNVLRFKGFDKPVNVEVYSIVGQKVMSAERVNTLSVADLDKGIYLVKVDGHKQAFKVIK